MLRSKALLWGLTFLTVFATQSFAAATRGVKFKADAIPLTAPATVAYSLDLLTLLSDPGSGHYTWSTSGDKPSWLTLDSANNKLSGTPPISEAGSPHSFRLGVQDGESGALTMLTMTVVIVPIWNQDPINLGVIKEDETLNFDLKTMVTVPGGGSVTFTAAANTMPAWMTLTDAGIVGGKPPWNTSHSNVGAYNGIKFIATTGSGGSSQVTAFGAVVKLAKGPKWTANPITIDDAHEDLAYSKDVSGTSFVTNFEQKALAFTITNGPAWLQITPAGNLFGTPGKNDVGQAIKVTVKVSSDIDGATYTDSSVLTLNVIHTPHTPTWSANPITLPDATTKLFYTQDLNQFVTNPDGDALTYTIVAGSGPSWATITASGVLSGTPTKENLGMNQWTVQVSMGPFAPQTTIIVKVVKRPPTWLQSPVVLANGKGNVPYSQSVAAFAQDPDGEPLTFSLVNGPTWAAVSSTGVISGTPTAADEGLETVRVAVSDGINVPVPNDVKIKIDAADKPPTIHQEAIAFTVKERQTFNVSLNQAQYVSDPQNYPLTFTLVDTMSWATLGANGALTLNPKFKDIGTYSLKFTVNNTKLTSTGFLNIVVQRDPRAPVWSQNPILFPAKATVPFTGSVSEMAMDLDGIPLTFSKKSGPAWLTVDANGTLSGTPKNSDAGDNTFIVTASNDMLGADTTVIISVGIQPPVINQNAISFTVKERSTFNVALNQAQYVQDPQGLPLTFTLVDAKDWVTLGADGALALKPIFKDIGTYALKFTVSNTKLTTTGVINIVVQRDPRAPIWLENPIHFDAASNQAFSATVAAKAQDLDGLPLTFSKVSGPSWLIVDAKGNLSGTPKTTDAGDNSFVVRVANDKLTADTVVVVTVKNQPPVIHQDQLAFTVKERQVFTVALNQAKYVQDPQGLPLTFALVDAQDWVTLGADGSLTLRPLFKNIGTYALKFTANNGQITSTGTLNITVVRDPRPPIWLQNPITFTGKSKIPFTASVANQAQDLDGLPITFSKKSGPAWLTVDAAGNLTGTPKNADVGTNNFVVTVKNDLASADVAVIITVLSNDVPPTIHQEAITFTVKERQTLTDNLNQAKYVEDPDGLPLTFSLVDTKDWVTLGSTGALTMKPVFKDIGNYSLKFSVTNGKLATQGLLNITVVRDPRAPVWSQNPLNFSATAQIPFSVSISDKVKDLDNIALTFSKKTGPAWLNVDAKGMLTGTPADSDVGQNTFIVTATNDLLGSDVNVIITVDPAHQAPYWSQDPIQLPNATVGKTYTQSIAVYAKSPSGDALTFSKLNGPSWAFLTTAGLVIGTPGSADLGMSTFQVRVTDAHNMSADATVLVLVIPGKPPHWLQDPIPLGKAQVGQLFQFNLAPYAKDDDGNLLHFKKLSGPGWFTVSDNGLLVGTPQKSDIGEFTAVFEVSNGMATAQAGGFGKVVDELQPPVITPNSLVFSVKERDTLQANLNSPQYVTDPLNLALTFQLIETADWVKLTSDGSLTLTPKHKDLGDHTYTLKVTNTKGQSTQGPILIHVLQNAQAVVWLQNPIRMDARVNVAFSNTLAGKAQSPDGLALTFSAKSGPGWLAVAGSGALSGTPLKDNIGENVYIVSVTDGNSSADATLIVTVKGNDTPQVDQIKVDEKVPGAPSENLWVIDNSWYNNWGYNDQMAALRSNLHWYYDALDTAQIHHTGMYVSSDYRDFKGLPIKAGDSTPLMTWSDGNLLKSFLHKMDATFNHYGCNSPIFSMFKLYQQSPGLDIYHNGFYTPGVPMDAMIMTIHNDAYRGYSQHTAQANWSPDNYATNFIEFEQKQQQPFRISALAPQCVSMGAPPEVGESNDGKDLMADTMEDQRDDQIEPPDPGQDLNGEYGGNPYKIIVNRTKGTYYVWDKCNTNMKKVLQDYAQKVIFRAYVNAKNRIKLTQKPANPSEIKLTIGNVTIPGNTGSATDKWYYDANTNEVVIRWNLLDMSTIKPGDVIQISYKY